MRVVARTLLAVAFVGSALLAQRREPLIGTVHDATGKPVGDAEVTLVEDDSELEGLDPVDVCRATTDARGHFKVSALVGVRYSALACGPEAEGQALVAPIVTGASCGQICALQIKVPGQRRTIAMPLVPGWRAVAGLHVRMSWRGCSGHHVELPIGEQGIEVPPLGVVAEFSLRDGQGAFLGSVHVPSTGNPIADLPLPFRVAVRVVDEAGAPVVGARVAVQDCSTSTVREGPAALTDENGRASLLWGGWQDPFDMDPDTFYVVATHPAFAEGASGWVCKEPFVGFETKQHRQRVLVVPLTKNEAVPRGAVDRAFAGRRARLWVMGNVRFPRGSYFLPRRYDVEIGADGTYALPQLPPGATNVRLQLPPLDGRRMVLQPTLARTLPSAQLADCDRIAGQVIDARGGPALGAQVLLANADGRVFMLPLTLDAAGRFECWLQRARWVLLAMDDTGWATHEFDGEVRQPIELRFTEKPHCRVRVVDAAGAPVAGASFEPGTFRYGLPVPNGLGNLLQELGWNTLGAHLRRVVTDARGEATLHFLPWPNVLPTAFAFVGDHRRRSDDVRIEAGDEVLVFTLR